MIAEEVELVHNEIVSYDLFELIDGSYIKVDRSEYENYSILEKQVAPGDTFSVTFEIENNGTKTNITKEVTKLPETVQYDRLVVPMLKEMQDLNFNLNLTNIEIEDLNFKFNESISKIENLDYRMDETDFKIEDITQRLETLENSNFVIGGGNNTGNADNPELKQLREENQMMKQELCKKDNSYSWCDKTEEKKRFINEPIRLFGLMNLFK